MTATMNGLRPLTELEIQAVTMHMHKTPIDEIGTRTGLSAADIAAAVDQARVLTQASVVAPDGQIKPRHPAPVAFRTPTPAPVPGVNRTTELQVKTATAPEHGQRLTTSALLAWADEHGPSRARTLAARIRESVTELRALHLGDTARAEAAAEVARLTAELEAAKARLKQAGGKNNTATAPAANQHPPGAAAAPDRKAHLAAVRTWAREQGHELAALGRIPAYIQRAYDLAHGATS